MHHELIRIFWPLDTAVTQRPGAVIGFKNSPSDFVVVTVIYGRNPLRLDDALKIGLLYRDSPYPTFTLFERCGQDRLHMLGLVNPSPRLPLTPEAPQLPFTFWVDPNSQFPKIERTSICQASGDNPVFQWIGFYPPSPSRMQFFSLSPIALSLDDTSDAYKWVAPLDRVDEMEEREKRRQARLVEKLKLHTVIKREPTLKDLTLPFVIEQINCSSELAALLHKNKDLVSATTSRRSLSVSERVVKSASNAWGYALKQLWSFWLHVIYPAFFRVFLVALISCRIFTEILLHVVEWRPFPSALAIKDISATAQQIDIRLQQFCYWPIQYMTLRDRKRNWQSITATHPEYIRFYNSLWLVANDMIIGLALGSYLMENSELVGRQIDHILMSWAIDGLRTMIVWLMGWPAGLKLNTELAIFLGDLFLWVIDYWASYIVAFRHHLPTIIYFMGCVSLTGVTMPISMFSDLISILTVHIDGFYLASAKIYNWQLTILFSLFHLFRGKKHNVLRNRIDNCDYDLDQLLLGTILFTILSFLLPTVLVFYVTFAGARILIIGVKAILEIWLAFLNHFPLFALMLRLKDNRRLPAGIRFELIDPRPRYLFSWLRKAVAPVTPEKDTNSYRPSLQPNQPFPVDRSVSASLPASSPQNAYVLLQSIPLPLHLTFHSYIHLFSRLRAHYVSFRVIICLLTGRFVPPINRKNLYRLQYSMLPARRVGVSDLWARLMDPRERQSGENEAEARCGECVVNNDDDDRVDSPTWDGNGIVVPKVVASTPMKTLRLPTLHSSLNPDDSKAAPQ